MTLNPISTALAPYKAVFIGVLVLVTVAALLYYRHTLIVQGEDKIALATFEATDKAKAQRTKELAAQHAVDMAELNTIGLKYESDLKAANAATDDVNSRLRAYTSARSRGLAHPGDPAAPAGPDAAAPVPGSVEAAVEGVNRAAAHDAAQVIALQTYITKECTNAQPHTH